MKEHHGFVYGVFYNPTGEKGKELLWDIHMLSASAQKRSDALNLAFYDSANATLCATPDGYDPYFVKKLKVSIA